MVPAYLTSTTKTPKKNNTLNYVPIFTFLSYIFVMNIRTIQYNVATVSFNGVQQIKNNVNSCTLCFRRNVEARSTLRVVNEDSILNCKLHLHIQNHCL